MRSAFLLLGAVTAAVVLLVATGTYRLGGDEASPAPQTGSVPPATGTARASAPDSRPALVLGSQAGDLAVGLTVRRASGSLELTVTVLGPDGASPDLLGVRVRGGGELADGTPCGAGCYRAALAAEPPTTVQATIARAGGDPVAASFDLPARWTSAAGLVRRATDAYRDLESVVYDERLESAPGNAIETRWRMQAPDRLSFAIAGGAAGVVVGNRRWDRTREGAAWVESPQDPLRLPQPPWAGRVEHASLIHSATVDGRPISVVAFETAAGGIPTWFTVRLDGETALPLELRMTTAAHFMTQRYRSFDDPRPIEPPRVR